MKYTYSKFIRDLEKKVDEASLEVHSVKWLFFNSEYFCGYSHLNDEVDEKTLNGFSKMIDLYINDNIPPQYILNKAFFFNYSFYVDQGCFIPRCETEQLVEEMVDSDLKSAEADLRFYKLGGDRLNEENEEFVVV